ncbi:MAG: sugar transferase [Clostridia bacterium]
MEEKQTLSSARQSLPRWDGPLPHPLYSKVIKRALDFIFALLFLPACVLVMLPIVLLIKCTSKGPIFYTALRGGYHNRAFNILKFRTMVVGADKYSSTTAFNDPRVTKVGRVLRRSKLDELPQLFNILKGDMSFIGPRPELLRYTTRYTSEQECILWVRPGISDPSSIKLISLDEVVGHDDPEGNYEARILGEKNRMRVVYAKEQSFLLDARLFVQTLGCVFKKNLNMGAATVQPDAARQGVNK